MNETREIKITELNNYREALRDLRWLIKRKEILARDNHQCRNCGHQRDLQVHHRQYRIIKSSQRYLIPWDYDSKLLITLCISCHEKGHRKYKVPVKFI
jgi:5-methylcytosine-specific restriction endonuclease McrA